MAAEASAAALWGACGAQPSPGGFLSYPHHHAWAAAAPPAYGPWGGPYPCGPPPGAAYWACGPYRPACSVGGPGCLGCWGCAGALAHPPAYLAAMAAAAAEGGGGPPGLAFMPVAEAGGRAGASAVRRSRVGSSDSSQDGMASSAGAAAGRSACELQRSPGQQQHQQARRAAAGEEEACSGPGTAEAPQRTRQAGHSSPAVAAQAAVAVARLLGVSPAEALGAAAAAGSRSAAAQQQARALQQLPGGVEYEPPLPVSDLFGPDDAWMAAPSGGLTRLAAAGAQGPEPSTAAACQAPSPAAARQPLASQRSAEAPSHAMPGTSRQTSGSLLGSVLRDQRAAQQGDGGGGGGNSAGGLPSFSLSLGSAGPQGSGGLSEVLAALSGCNGLSCGAPLCSASLSDLAGGEFESEREAALAELAAALDALDCGSSPLGPPPGEPAAPAPAPAPAPQTGLQAVPQLRVAPPKALQFQLRLLQQQQQQQQQQLLQQGGGSGSGAADRQLMPPPPPRLQVAVCARAAAAPAPASAGEEGEEGTAETGGHSPPPRRTGSRRIGRLAVVATQRTRSLQIQQVDGAADSPSASGASRGRSPASGRKRAAPAAEPAAGPAAGSGSSDRTASLALDAMGCGGGWDDGAVNFGEQTEAGQGGPTTGQGLDPLGAQPSSWGLGAASPGAAAVAAGGSSAFQDAWQAAALQEQALQQQQQLVLMLSQHGSGATAVTSALAGIGASPLQAQLPAAGLQAGPQPSTPHAPPHIMKTSSFRGVSWCKRRQLWEAAISINGKRERLGFHISEEGAARAYDVVAAWRNREISLQQEERAREGPRRRRRRKPTADASAATADDSEGEEAEEDVGDKGGEGGGAGRPAATQAGSGASQVARKRLMGHLLPLNLGAEAPAAGDPRLQGGLDELLEGVREAARQRLKEELPEQRSKRQRTQASCPSSATATATGTATAAWPADTAGLLPAGASGGGSALCGGLPGLSSSLGASAAAGGGPAWSSLSLLHQGGAGSVVDQAMLDPGDAAAAAAMQAVQGGASLAAAAEAAGAAAAEALQAVPVQKSSRFQGVCLCGTNNKRWQAQVTHRRKRHYLGMHASEEEAARAYDQGALCLLGAAASTNYPAEQYDVAALQALDIADLAARLKAASRAAMAAASRAADAVGAGGAGRGAAAQALHQQMAQVQQSAAAKRPRSA